MKIENSFTVDAPIGEAWELLTNIAEIAPCLPGAKLTDETDGVYSGGIKVKVGPVTSEYKGSAEFVEKDDANYKAVINGKGRDTRGAGNAQALITAQMFDEGASTRVDIETDLKISGKVAQFGRGVMQDVSTKLLGQFAECLESKIGEPAAIDGIAAASAEETEAKQAAADVDSSGDAAEADDASDSATGEAVEAADEAASGSSGKAVAAGTAAAAGVGAAATSTVSGTASSDDDDDDDDDEVLDLLDVAGDAVFKRFFPIIAIGVLLLIILIVILAL